MTHARRISSAHAVALPRPSPSPAESTEWIVAAVAVVLLFAGLIF